MPPFDLPSSHSNDRSGELRFWTKHPRILRSSTILWKPWPQDPTALTFRSGPPLYGSLIALLNGQPIGGFLGGVPWVDPAMRGRGYGRSIILAAYRQRLWRFNLPLGYTASGRAAMTAAYHFAQKTVSAVDEQPSSDTRAEI